jgi:hypothetical protein
VLDHLQLLVQLCYLLLYFVGLLAQLVFCSSQQAAQAKAVGYLC